MIRLTRERSEVYWNGRRYGMGETVSLDAEEERWLVETGQAKYVKPVAVPEPGKPEPEAVPAPKLEPEPEPAPAQPYVAESAGDADAADAEGTGKKGRAKRRRVV